MNQKKNENKLNKAGKTILYTFILMVVMGILSDGSGSIIGVMAVIFIAVGVAALVIYFVKQANKPKEEATVTRGYSTHESSQPRKYDPAEIQDRDDRRRLDQLDSFLRNGIIDKREYAVLRAKYQRELSE
ncbi:MAG: hypothetical protein ACI4O0_04400 [Candidatus Limivicinus sp.]